MRRINHYIRWKKKGGKRSQMVAVVEENMVAVVEENMVDTVANENDDGGEE